MSTIPTSSIFPPVASGGGSTDPEIVRDTIATALVAGSGVTITVDDPGNTITIATSGGAGVTGGTATLDFGAAPGTNTASVVVSEGVTASSRIRAWIQGSTADHNEYEHSRIFPNRIGLGTGDIVSETSFTIHAETELRLTGEVAVAWEYA